MAGSAYNCQLCPRKTPSFPKYSTGKSVLPPSHCTDWKIGLVYS